MSILQLKPIEDGSSDIINKVKALNAIQIVCREDSGIYKKQKRERRL